MPPDSFLPNEYVEHRRDRRTSCMALILFLVVVGSIGAAFLYRNATVHTALDQQREVMERYAQAEDQVATLTDLQRARDDMLWKSTLAAALLERVPRSLLLEHVIDCMPEHMGLTTFALHSTIIRTPPSQAQSQNGRAPRRQTRQAAPSSDVQAIDVPSYTVRLQLSGIAPTDLHVSRFLSALNAAAMFQNVRMESTMEDLVEDQAVRRFEITCTIHPCTTGDGMPCLPDARAATAHAGDDQ